MNFKCITPLIVMTMFILTTAAICRADAVLTVKTDPDGIEVWLNDQFIGQSPVFNKKIKMGRYVLKLVDPVRRTSVTEDLFLENNDTAVIERTMSSKFGSLRVTSQPEDAEVVIATELGRAPFHNDLMNPGKYRIEIRPQNPRYRTCVKEVVIESGATVTLNETLKKEPFPVKKNVVSLALFAGTTGGFIWAIVEQGRYRMYNERSPVDQSAVNDAALKRTLGIIIGAGCAVGLEVVTFF